LAHAIAAAKFGAQRSSSERHGFGIVVGKTVDWYLSALVSKNRTRKGCRRLPGESVAHQLLADPRPVEAGKPRQFRSSVLAVGFVG